MECAFVGLTALKSKVGSPTPRLIQAFVFATHCDAVATAGPVHRSKTQHQGSRRSCEICPALMNSKCKYTEWSSQGRDLCQ